MPTPDTSWYSRHQLALSTTTSKEQKPTGNIPRQERLPRLFCFLISCLPVSLLLFLPLLFPSSHSPFYRTFPFLSTLFSIILPPLFFLLLLLFAIFSNLLPVSLLPLFSPSYYSSFLFPPFFFLSFSSSPFFSFLPFPLLRSFFQSFLSLLPPHLSFLLLLFALFNPSSSSCLSLLPPFSPAAAHVRISVIVKDLTGKQFRVEVEPSSQVIQIKRSLFNQYGLTVDNIALMLHGQRLREDETIADNGIVEGDIIEMTTRYEGGEVGGI
ncbi:Ubiquitin [Penaeus vannamei]|uniref:Ubiquitin n=1 Tax=Penaeus vannamei TaxID=6689 RepID=A0A3R7MG49_PENVA|nr:Ubiquitin [Penaeus vannamei]